MDNRHYLASTYLRVLQADEGLMRLLATALGTRLTRALEAEYIVGEDIDATFLALAATGLDSWVLHYGDRVSIASHGPLGFAVLSAPDLQTALQVLVDYTVIRTSTYACSYNLVGNRAELLCVDQTGNPLIGRWLIESGFSVVQRLIETIMAHPLGDNARIYFAYPEPAYKAELEAFYGIECSFNASQNCLSIPASWCSIASPLSDPNTFNTNLHKCQELRTQMSGDKDLAESVRMVFTNYFRKRSGGDALSTELPSLESLAAGHHQSPRTLARKLDAQGTSYKALLEEIRQQRAVELLSTTHLSIADIADRLAYQEPANFVRAFKSWYNMPPGAWRRTASTDDV